MQYEQTEVKNNIKEVSSKVMVNAAKRLSTPRLIYILIMRHKVFLMATGNIILVLNWTVPEWTEIVKSMF